MPSVKPIIHTMLLADAVFIDRITGKVCVLGIFNTCRVQLTCDVLVQFSGGLGSLPAVLRVTSPDGFVCAVMRGQFDTVNRTGLGVTIIKLTIRFPGPGVYELQLVADDGEVLKAATVTVKGDEDG
jgi:hypothetical protein